MSQDWKQKLEALQKKVEQESKRLPVGLVVTCALCVRICGCRCRCIPSVVLVCR